MSEMSIPEKAFIVGMILGSAVAACLIFYRQEAITDE